jgi:hypothetical protein
MVTQAGAHTSTGEQKMAKTRLQLTNAEYAEMLEELERLHEMEQRVEETLRYIASPKFDRGSDPLGGYVNTDDIALRLRGW